MSEKEKNIARQLAEVIPKLDRENQKYILGYAEGIAELRESQKSNQPQATAAI